VAALVAYRLRLGRQQHLLRIVCLICDHQARGQAVQRGFYFILRDLGEFCVGVKGRLGVEGFQDLQRDVALAVVQRHWHWTSRARHLSWWVALCCVVVSHEATYNLKRYDDDDAFT